MGSPFFFLMLRLSTKIAGPFLYRRLLRDLYAFHRWTKGQVQTTVATYLHMGYTQKLLPKAVQIWGVSVTDMCLLTPHMVFSCSAVEILEICTA